MSIWEDVYSSHEQSKRAPVDPKDVLNQPQPQRRQAMPDSLSNGVNHTGSRSFEDMYYNSRGTETVEPRTLARDPLAVEQKPQGGEPLQQTAPVKPVKSRFMPRVQSGNLSVPYPAILSKMHYSLSDSWANIMLQAKERHETLLICGAGRKEGATFISFHMAMFLSKEFSMKVLYVDTNLNHTAIPGIQNLPGLYSFVSENQDLDSLIVQTEFPGLYLLPSGSGKVGKNISSNMLTREPIETLMQFSRCNFDITIIDGQPLASSPVMIEFARFVDMTVLVCRYAYSRYEVCKMAIDKLQKYGVTFMGVILNDRKFPVPPKVYKLMG